MYRATESSYDTNDVVSAIVDKLIKNANKTKPTYSIRRIQVRSVIVKDELETALQQHLRIIGAKIQFV